MKLTFGGKGWTPLLSKNVISCLCGINSSRLMLCVLRLKIWSSCEINFQQIQQLTEKREVPQRECNQGPLCRFFQELEWFPPHPDLPFPIPVQLSNSLFSNFFSWAECKQQKKGPNHHNSCSNASHLTWMFSVIICVPLWCSSFSFGIECLREYFQRNWFMKLQNYLRESVGVRQYLQHSIFPYHVLRCGVVGHLREPWWHCILRCQDRTALRPPFSSFWNSWKRTFRVCSLSLAPTTSFDGTITRQRMDGSFTRLKCKEVRQTVAFSLWIVPGCNERQ